MSRRLTAQGEAVLDKKSVRTYSAIYINGSLCQFVSSYSYNFSKQFGAASLTVNVANDGRFGLGGSSEIVVGQPVVLKEGLYNSLGSLESFDKFTGIVTHLSPQVSGGDNSIQVTAMDKISKLEGLDINKLYQSDDYKIYSIDESALDYGGVLLLESTLESKLTQATGTGSSVTIYIESTDGFEVGVCHIGQVIDTNQFVITQVNADSLVIESITISKVAGQRVRQIMSQRDSTLGKGNLFDFGYWSRTGTGAGETTDFPHDFSLTSPGQNTYYFQRVQNISPMKLPIIMTRLTGSNPVQLDPKWSGFEVNYAMGQLVLGELLNIHNFAIWSTFYYYPTDSCEYGEDIIQDLLTLPDGYGNTIFTVSDYTTDLNTEDGVSVDNLVYNRSISTIDGVDYAVGQVWYHKYSNIISTLSAGNYTLPGGKIILGSPSQRYGRIILDSAVSTPADGDVTYNVNYNFKTLQATGVRIPFIDFREGVKDRFAAIQELKKQLAPNYIIRSSGDGKIWGQHLRQNYTEDYDLKLIQSLQYTSNTDIYSRVKLYGENAVPRNILTDATYTTEGTYKAYVSGIPLVWLGATTYLNSKAFYEMTIPDSILNQNSLGALLPEPTKPNVWINGIRYATDTIDSVPFESWGYIKNGDAFVGLYFNNAANLNNKVIFYSEGAPKIFDWNGAIVSQIDQMKQMNGGNMAALLDTKNGIYRWKPADDPGCTNKTDWTTEMISKITSCSFNIDYSEAWQWNPDGNDPYRFLINKDYVVMDETKGFKDLSVKNGLHNFQFVGPNSYHHHGDPGSGTTDKLGCDARRYTDRYLYTGMRMDDMAIDNDPINNYLSFEIEMQGYAVVSHVEFVLDSDGWFGIVNFFCWDRISSSWIQIHPLTSGYNSPDSDWPDGVASYQWKLPYVYTNKIQIRISGGTEWYWDSAQRHRFTAALFLYEAYIWCYNGQANITADFWYQKAFEAPTNEGVEKLHDGLWDTQLQTMYAYEPLEGHRYITFDMPQYMEDGACQYPIIEAIDLVAGWFMPNSDDPNRRYEIQNSYSMEWYDGSDWYPLGSQEGTNFSLASGETKSFEQDALGDGFRPQKLSLLLEKAGVIEGFGPDRWVVSLVELSAYKNIKLTGEAKLIPATYLTTACSIGQTTIYIHNTSQFSSSGMAYIEDDQITYTGKTSTTLTGVTGISSTHAVDSRVSQRLESSSTTDIYDPDDLLQKLQDKLYKEAAINKYLNTQDKVDEMARLYLKELCMNITSVNAPVACRPDAVLGDTVRVYDPQVDISDIYFVEQINSNNGSLTFTLSKYWSIDQEVSH
jgi:hypothetical protein